MKWFGIIFKNTDGYLFLEHSDQAFGYARSELTLVGFTVDRRYLLQLKSQSFLFLKKIPLIEVILRSFCELLIITPNTSFLSTFFMFGRQIKFHYT